MLSVSSLNMKRAHKIWVEEPGQATVEFALVLPFLFLFSLTVVQIGSVANDQLALNPIDVNIELSEILAQVTLTYQRQVNIPIIGKLFNNVTLQATTSMPRELTSETPTSR